LAQRLLADVAGTVDSFVKVTPRDYQAVLRTRENAEREGLDPNGDEVWNRILEVTGG
jgi:glutamate synthase (NADPH/NADH) large chain